MEFAGIQKISLIEYPGKISSILFTPGCNFRCPYCYNRELVLHPEKIKKIPEKEVLDFLKSNKKWIDAIVITGGEPTIHGEGLMDFMRKVKKSGFLIGIETNGSNPYFLRAGMKKGILDFVGMDIKAPLVWSKYKKAWGVKKTGDFENVKKSIKLLINSKIDHEFRTTVVPGLITEKDVIEIAKTIKKAKRYTLQQFIPIAPLNKKLKKVEPYSYEELDKMIEKAEKYVNCEVR